MPRARPRRSRCTGRRRRCVHAGGRGWTCSVRAHASRRVRYRSSGSHGTWNRSYVANGGRLAPAPITAVGQVSDGSAAAVGLPTDLVELIGVRAVRNLLELGVESGLLVRRRVADVRTGDGAG